MTTASYDDAGTYYDADGTERCARCHKEFWWFKEGGICSGRCGNESDPPPAPDGEA